MQYLTRSKHNMYDIVHIMKKAVKEKKIDIACYCAYELYGEYKDKMWDALIELADCDLMKDELIAVREADDMTNKGKKGYDRDPLFVAKAIVLLCIDANEDRTGVNDIPESNASMDKAKDIILDDSKIPDWVFDCHTLRGKRKGKTDLDMTMTEENALTPKRKNFFDDCSWYYAYNDDRKRGVISEDEWQRFLKFAEGRPVK